MKKYYKTDKYLYTFGFTVEKPLLPFGFHYQDNTTHMVRTFSFKFFEIFFTRYKR